MAHPTRRIDSFELADRLRALERMGARVPTLDCSIWMPVYFATTADGVEVYLTERGAANVGPGEVIDSHGNVVNLRELEADVFSRLRIPSEDKPREYRYSGITLDIR